MPTIQGSERSGVLEKSVLVARLDRLFRLTTPQRKAARDGGAPAVVEHRIGPDGGAYTMRDLLEKLGLEKQLADFMAHNRREFKNEKNWNVVLEQYKKGLRSKCNRAVSAYRKHLETLYANHPSRALLPMFAFVHRGGGEDALYLQGLQDAATLKLVVGDDADDALWSETVFQRTKPSADMNARARRTAQALLSLPHVNKDIAYRLNFVSKGEVPPKLEFDGKK